MTAIAIREPGGPEALAPDRRPVPRPGPRELLIRVHAAGVNRPDVFQREGRYPPPPGVTDILGLEVAGEVAEMGAESARYLIGARVVALVPGGGYAEYCVADEGSTLLLPAGLSMVEGAGVPETFFTVWHNVFQRGRLVADETLLVHGGASGIGTTAIQLAKAFGARVIATVGSDDKRERVRALGADLAVNYRTQDFVAEVRAFTAGRGVELILDMVGGDYVARNYAAAAEDGRIVQIAVLHGGKATTDVRQLMVKRLTHTGSTLRPRPPAVKAAIARELAEKVWPLLADRSVRPVIDSEFPLREAAAAHRRLEAGDHVGKVILRVMT